MVRYGHGERLRDAVGGVPGNVYGGFLQVSAQPGGQGVGAAAFYEDALPVGRYPVKLLVRSRFPEADFPGIGRNNPPGQLSGGFFCGRGAGRRQRQGRQGAAKMEESAERHAVHVLTDTKLEKESRINKWLRSTWRITSCCSVTCRFLSVPAAPIKRIFSAWAI